MSYLLDRHASLPKENHRFHSTTPAVDAAWGRGICWIRHKDRSRPLEPEFSACAPSKLTIRPQATAATRQPPKNPKSANPAGEKSDGFPSSWSSYSASAAHFCP